jgi:hypothetical protein
MTVCNSIDACRDVVGSTCVTINDQLVESSDPVEYVPRKIVAFVLARGKPNRGPA